MANQTVAAVFDRYEDAAAAVNKLEAAGVAHSDISIVSNDSAHRAGDSTLGTTNTGDAASTGAGTGASLGTVVGGGAGLLAGLGMLAIPGLGPVVAAGWLVSALVGAGAGAAAGGLLGSLTGAGVSETDAHTYAEAVNRGGTLVTVRATEANHARVVDILNTNGTIDMDERQAAWRSEGWGGRYAGDAETSTGSMTGATMGSRPLLGEGVVAPGSDLDPIDPLDRPAATGTQDINPRPRVRSYPQI